MSCTLMIQISLTIFLVLQSGVIPGSLGLQVAASLDLLGQKGSCARPFGCRAHTPPS